MARARKEYRELTVSEAVGYSRKPAPMLRIQGLWLQDLGFNVGDPILVKCEDGKLIITLDQVRAEAMEQERAFMEEETRKLDEQYQKAETELWMQCVAERRRKFENRRNGKMTNVLNTRKI